MQTQAEAFGRNFRLAMAEKGLRQVDVAEDLGYSRTSVSSWAKGSCVPGVKTLYKLAQYLGVTTHDLLDRHTDADDEVAGGVSVQPGQIKLLRSVVDEVFSLTSDQLDLVHRYIKVIKKG